LNKGTICKKKYIFKADEIHEIKSQKRNLNSINTQKIKIYMYDLNNNLIKTFESKTDAAKELGILKRRLNHYIESQKAFHNKYKFRIEEL
jgi:hypothetical protein